MSKIKFRGRWEKVKRSTIQTIICTLYESCREMGKKTSRGWNGNKSASNNEYLPMPLWVLDPFTETGVANAYTRYAMSDAICRTITRIHRCECDSSMYACGGNLQQSLHQRDNKFYAWYSVEPQTPLKEYSPFIVKLDGRYSTFNGRRNTFE